MSVRITLLLALLFLTFRVEAASQRDKLLHGTTAFTGQVLCAAGLSEFINKTVANGTCFVVVNALGAAVEAGAFGPNTPETGDVIANVLGTTAGAVVVEWKF